MTLYCSYTNYYYYTNTILKIRSKKQSLLDKFNLSEK